MKSHSGRRTVPIVAALRDYLLDHLAQTRRQGSELIFGPHAGEPVRGQPATASRDTAWIHAGLERITPHELRHSYASVMIAAGVNPKALQTFMGHANISITLDTYGHLMPGSEAEAAALVESYITAQQERAEDAARAAGDGLTGERTGEQEPVNP